MEGRHTSCLYHHTTTPRSSASAGHKSDCATNIPLRHDSPRFKIFKVYLQNWSLPRIHPRPKPPFPLKWHLLLPRKVRPFWHRAADYLHFLHLLTAAAVGTVQVFCLTQAPCRMISISTAPRTTTWHYPSLNRVYMYTSVTRPKRLARTLHVYKLLLCSLRWQLFRAVNINILFLWGFNIVCSH